MEEAYRQSEERKSYGITPLHRGAGTGGSIEWNENPRGYGTVDTTFPVREDTRRTIEDEFR